MDDDALIALAAALALDAGAAILAVRRRGFDVVRKEDRSPVTEADHAAEAIIVAGLREAAPDIPVIAEEEVAAGRITEPTRGILAGRSAGRHARIRRRQRRVRGEYRPGARTAGRCWAWWRSRRPANCSAASSDAARGSASDRQQTTVSARLPPEEGLTVLASRYHGSSTRLDDFLRDKRVAKLINFGSSVKFCRLAEGIADLYPRFGRTMEWDTCAPQAVLEAAGGTVRTFDGDELRYGKPGWENPHFVCTGRLPS